MSEALRIGITGGIGSGKSFVCRLLEQRGIPVYDSDSAAKRLMVEHPGIQERLTALLGDDAYCNGALNKNRIASFLFASSENARLINSIVHPVVKEDFRLWASRHADCEAVALECAILFEAGFTDVVDFIVTVDAPLPLRIQRAMVRDGVCEEKIRSRIAAQMSDAMRREKSHFIIENDACTPLDGQLDRLFEAIKKRKSFL